MTKRIVLFILIAVLGTLLSILVSIKRQDVEPWSVRMAKSEVKRSPKAWMLDYSQKPKWNYGHGLVCKAMLDVYDQYHDTVLYEYVRQYADTMILENGSIIGYKPEEYNLDRLNSGKLLFRLIDNEQEPRFKKGLDLLRSQLYQHPRTSEGGFIHKTIYPHQMWLDGLYMGVPFYAEYISRYGDYKLFSDVVNQFLIVKKHLYDPATGLYCHGWDEKKEQRWADSISGKSPHIWGRALGWYSMALVDALDFIPDDFEGRDSVKMYFCELMKSIVNYQDTTLGVWYQIVNLPERQGNYPESSSSCMFVYSLLKGVRKGYLDQSYLEPAKKGYQGILSGFIRENPDGTLSVTKCCAVAGLGGKPYRDASFAYYVGEPVRDDDPKAVGSFILASLEIEKAIR